MKKKCRKVATVAFTLFLVLIFAPVTSWATPSATLGIDNTTLGTLILTLTNTSSDDITDPAQVLMGVLFDIAGSPTLTKVSADIGSSTFVTYGANNNNFDGNTSDTNVSGEWAYKKGAFTGVTQGYAIGTAGFSPASWLGSGDLFCTPNGTTCLDRDQAVAPDGADFGLLSTGDNTATGSNGFKNNGPYVKDATIFTFHYDASLGPLVISNIQFLYGTSSTENVVPEPGTLLLLGSGLIGLGGIARRMRGKVA